MADPRREIPGVDRLLRTDAFAALVSTAPRRLLVETLQGLQQDVRTALATAGAPPARIVDPMWYAEEVSRRLAARERPSLRPVVNATGVVLHTNLGRAPLADVARAAVDRVSRSYSNVEYDTDVGERGSRHSHCAALLTELTGAGAALVVNNNAAAVVLALNTLAAGREAVVSRGELVEIGGSFRIPAIMETSGARMVEVGATNRTRIADYDAVISERTGVLLKVHRSNFRMAGFTAEVSLAELVELGRARGVPAVYDLGSGLLLDPEQLGLANEPTPVAALRAGAALVTMSGDKLLGGPQAGILLGDEKLIEPMRRNPLCRAFRVDKLTLAALEATLALYRDPARALREIPVLRMLAATAGEVGTRARATAERLEAAGIAAEVIAGTSAVGGGACPELELPTALVALSSKHGSADGLSARLRAGEPPVVARIVDGRVVLDLRTVAPEEEDRLVEQLRKAVRGLNA